MYANAVYLNTKKKDKRFCTNEDKNIVEVLNNLKNSIDMVYMRLSYTTEEALIDSLIYELKAINMKYQYYLRLAKDKGVLSKGLYLA